jgi:septum formation inhibitor-activating ATPase MinD
MALGRSLSSIRTFGPSSPQFSPFVGPAVLVARVMGKVGKAVAAAVTGMAVAVVGTVVVVVEMVVGENLGFVINLWRRPNILF